MTTGEHTPTFPTDDELLEAYGRSQRPLESAQGPYFGEFGGRYTAESLSAALDDLTQAWAELKDDPAFREELLGLHRTYSGRPSILTEAPRFGGEAGGVRVFLKREDLNHTGSHKINNVLGQALLTRKVGKKRIIAETGAGQHGVATATAAALMGLECTVYMGAEDMRRQALNVARMRLLGTEVVGVTAGSRTLKDAINEAFRDWVTNVETTNYVFGTAAGPHPFPGLVRDLQRIISDEARAQLLAATGALPDAVLACIGGGSNAIGMFNAFLDDEDVRIVGFEAAGEGVETGKHACSIGGGETGVLHGAMTYLLQDEDGQTQESHSISAGLDYSAVGPEHAWLASIGRVEYQGVTDTEAMEAFRLLCRTEGIIPAIESSHALAGALRLGREWRAEADAGRADGAVPPVFLVSLSGRGDKDVATAASWFELVDEEEVEGAAGDLVTGDAIDETADSAAEGTVQL